MSVLIVGMEMPSDYAVVVIHKDGTVRKYYDCVETVGTVIGTAVIVPPHGKLIDSEKLILRLEQQRAEVASELPKVHEKEDGYTHEDYIFERNGDMISILRNQAAVIPADEGE